MATKKQKKSAPNISQGSVRRLVEKEKAILGIDIGSSTVKIVEMKKNHNFDKWIIEALPIGMINQGRIEAQEPLAQIISDALKRYSIRTKDVALCLSSSELIVRELTFPSMEDEQIRENINQEISSMLPQEHEKYYIDYKILEYLVEPGEAEGKIRVLAVAAPEQLLDNYIDTLKQAGLRVNYIDVFPNIAGKLCSLEYRKSSIDRTKNICMIDFGANKTEIVIFQNGNYYLHKTISYGGEYLTSVIAKKADMDEIDAEDYKSQTNFFIGNPDDQVVKQVYDYFEYLVRDFARTMEFYNNRSGESVERVYIMGGGSLLAGLPKYLQEQFSIDVRPAAGVFDNFKKVGAVGRHISIFSQAIGVTFREEWRYER